MVRISGGRPDPTYSEVRDNLDSETIFKVGDPPFAYFRGYVVLPGGGRAWIDEIRTNFAAMLDEDLSPSRGCPRHGFWVWTYAIGPAGEAPSSESEAAGYAMEILLTRPERRRVRAREERRQVFFMHSDGLSVEQLREGVEGAHVAAVDALRAQHDVATALWDAVSVAQDFEIGCRTFRPGAEEGKKIEIDYEKLLVGTPAMVYFVAPALGLNFSEFTAEIATKIGSRWTSGVYVSTVEADGLAKRVGIEPGDVILSVDGRPVNSVVECKAFVGENPALANTTLQIERNGAVHIVSMRPNEAKIELKEPAANAAPGTESLFEVEDEGQVDTIQGARRLAQEISAQAAQKFDRVFVFAHKHPGRFKHQDGSLDGSGFYDYLKRMHTFAASLRRSLGPDRVVLLTLFDQNTLPEHWSMIHNRHPEGVLIASGPAFIAERNRRKAS